MYSLYYVHVYFQLRCCDIKDFGKERLIPPYCLITVNRLHVPEAKEALHYAVPLVNVADSEPPTILIDIAPRFASTNFS